MSFLKIQNLDISYKTRKETIIASQNVSFTLEKGEILGSDFIDSHWDKMVKWHGEEIHHELKDQRVEIVEETLKNQENAESVIESFHRLAS